MVAIPNVRRCCVSEMLERATRAIMETECERSSCEMRVVGFCMCRDKARAVLTAIREPTPAMIAASNYARVPANADPSWEENSASIYQAMIDAALKE